MVPTVITAFRLAGAHDNARKLRPPAWRHARLVPTPTDAERRTASYFDARLIDVVACELSRSGFWIIEMYTCIYFFVFPSMRSRLSRIFVELLWLYLWGSAQRMKFIIGRCEKRSCSVAWPFLQKKTRYKKVVKCIKKYSNVVKNGHVFVVIMITNAILYTEKNILYAHRNSVHRKRIFIFSFKL